MTPKRVVKRRLVTSFQNLDANIQAQVKELYPLGYSDAMMRIDKPNGDFFYAVPFETEEIFYLVKINVKIDDSSSIDKDLFDDEIKESDELKGDEVVDLNSDDDM